MSAELYASEHLTWSVGTKPSHCRMLSEAAGLKHPGMMPLCAHLNLTGTGSFSKAFP